MKTVFPDRLKQLRVDAKLKQSDLANILKTTQRRISYFEKGKVEPDLTTLCAIARHFEVTTDYLLGVKEY